MIRHLRAALVTALGGALAVSACALPNDDEPQLVGDPELAELANPSTTTSTTEAGQTQERDIYFFDVEDEVLVAERMEVSLDATVADVLSRLTSGPDGSSMRTEVPTAFEISGTDVDEDGVLTILLTDEAVRLLSGSQATRAVAQMVVTATQLQGRGIDEVRFEEVDEGGSIQIPAGPEGTDTAEPVDECDYPQFLSDRLLAEFDCRPTPGG